LEVRASNRVVDSIQYFIGSVVGVLMFLGSSELLTLAAMVPSWYVWVSMSFLIPILYAGLVGYAKRKLDPLKMIGRAVHLIGVALMVIIFTFLIIVTVPGGVEWISATANVPVDDMWRVMFLYFLPFATMVSVVAAVTTEVIVTRTP